MIAIDDLGDIFDIEIGDAPVAISKTTPPAKSAAKRTVKTTRAVKQVLTTKKAVTIPAKTVEKQAATKASTKKPSTTIKITKAKPVPKKV